MAHQQQQYNNENGENVQQKAKTFDDYKNLTQSIKAQFHKVPSKEHTIVHIDTPSHPLFAQKFKNVKTTPTEDTTPCHICCVLDVSGSMGIELPCKDETGEENLTGLSILDVVKYSTLVISQSLREQDMMSIVTYSNDAETELEPTFMDGEGKKKVSNVLRTIRTLGMTNLWSGVVRAFDLSSSVGNSFNNNIFLLTDGLPNVDPPLGYERSFKRLMEKKPVFGTMSTFGFGYDLDSSLLHELSKFGGGYFSFIPDLGFVGTCFINAIANSRCMFGLKSHLLIRTKKMLDLDEIENITRDGELCFDEEEENCLRIDLNPLRYGHSVDIVLNDKLFDEAETNSIDLVFSVLDGYEIEIPVQGCEEALHFQHTDQFHLSRTKFVKEVHNFISSPFFHEDGGHKSYFSTTAETEKSAKKKKGSVLEALMEDIRGQASEAISSESYFNRWGKHYLHSLSNAHLHQFCNNFKDPGVQSYGEGDLFRALQEELNDTFDELPPPKKFQVRRKMGMSNASLSQVSSGTKDTDDEDFSLVSLGSSFVSVPKMSSMFNNRSIICVHGDTKVVTKPPSHLNSCHENSVPISELQKGDRVATSDGTFVPVRCLVQTILDKKKTVQLVRVGERLLVTPYHPVQIPLLESQNENSRGNGGKWVFPIDVKGSELVEVDCSSVFNLILENEGDVEDGDVGNNRSCAVMMDGIPCVTLGHGILEGDVVPHSYFGTDAVLNDLSSNFPDGWEKGHIILQEGDVRRDPASGLVSSIVPLL